ncbi:nucleotidyltransferase domain-containing protein [bacterium]|nr:nucleotidyltransferase domain-containing protein [bacterium]
MKKILEKIYIDAKHLKKILTILKMRAPDSTVIAFGSRVEFTATPNSDLDLAIICDKQTAQKTIPRIVDDFQESDIPFNIDILDYNRLPDNMKKNIDKEFVEIYHPEQKKSRLVGEKQL